MLNVQLVAVGAVRHCDAEENAVNGLQGLAFS